MHQCCPRRTGVGCLARAAACPRRLFGIISVPHSVKCRAEPYQARVGHCNSGGGRAKQSPDRTKLEYQRAYGEKQPFPDFRKNRDWQPRGACRIHHEPAPVQPIPEPNGHGEARRIKRNAVYRGPRQLTLEKLAGLALTMFPCRSLAFTVL